ncbi:hypothetical protein [Streptomyces sp. NBC_00304]|uniref:hypothetical protein n=1 Tax=Streptomyces sp. NBC_00304 TaxID=2975706 RepID=UPI002E2BCDC8|nr:hypothetical protein [Streptomyces sp. NBC_00304]
MYMPKRAVRDSLIAAMAVAMLSLATGCGGSDDKAAPDAGSAAADGTPAADGSGQLAVPDGTSDEVKKTYILENALAACMKKQGFTYTPHVVAPSTDDPLAGMDGEDYAVSKKFRQKYGFGMYAADAYPNDPKAPFSNAGGRVGGKTVTPADDDEKGMTPAQLKAYDAALNGVPPKTTDKTVLDKPRGCTAVARVKAYGPEQSAAAAKKEQSDREETNRTNGLALNGDTQLVQLAQQYATCLRGQGIPVSTTQPTGMSTMVRLDRTAKLPEHHQLSSEAALPLLTKDIDVALKDLECGKAFRAAYYPKEKAHPYWGDGA